MTLSFWGSLAPTIDLIFTLTSLDTIKLMYQNKSTENISLIFYIVFFIMNFSWMQYALELDNKIMFIETLIALGISIIVIIMYYKYKK
jgi:uncharacterized protein with PQ loop repeat